MKKINKIISFIFSLAVLTGCSGGEVISQNQSYLSIEEDSSSISEASSSINEITNPTFRTCLTLDGEVYIPTEEINVIWTNSSITKVETIGSDGYASTNELDGEFDIHLQNLPSGYTYNPNIYSANNDNPYCAIELIKISTPTSGTGADKYSKCYKMSEVGTYRATFKNSRVSTVYYEFSPKEAGVYSVESLVDSYDDIINPSVEIYTGSSSYKNLLETQNSGGFYLKGGYTINFKWEDEFDQSNISDNGSAVIAFGIKAESKTGEYPLHVDFTLKYISYYEYDKVTRKTMVAEQANFVTPDYDSSKYVLTNTDGKTGNYDGQIVGNTTIVLDGDDYKYNPDDGYYHHYDTKTNTFKEILVAYITKPCPYYPNDGTGALNVIEYSGNKNLTVSNGTENYKTFIEVDYANACNKDGVCYVTQELKEFLQKFSISQRLFMDGNGIVEQYKRYASEDDQWLFACAYYKEI